MSRWPLTWAVLALFQYEDEHGGDDARFAYARWWSIWRTIQAADGGRPGIPGVED